MYRKTRAKLVGRGKARVEVGREVEVEARPGMAGRSGTVAAGTGGGEQPS